MASAASLIPELKRGRELGRQGYSSMHDSLWLDEENRVAYTKYYGEGEEKTEYFTLEEIATWTDDGDWEVTFSPPDQEV